MDKRCFKCLSVKPIEAFYKHAAMGDGRLNKCIECTKADVKRHRLENIERLRAYDRMRASMPHRVAARKEYAQTQQGKNAHRRALRVSAKLHPERRKARVMFGNAVRDGRVTPWPVCAVPECERKPEGHHPDYSRPLDVVWLCTKHHRQAHQIEREELADA
jgi:hypothetical protein